jgi:hypothetical protein
MQIRMVFEAPEGRRLDEADAVAHTLLRFAQGVTYLGAGPRAPTPLYDRSGRIIGRAWVETDEAVAAPVPAAGGAA